MTEAFEKSKTTSYFKTLLTTTDLDKSDSVFTTNNFWWKLRTIQDMKISTLQIQYYLKRKVGVDTMVTGGR